MNKRIPSIVLATAAALGLSGCATTNPSQPKKPSQRQIADSLPRNRVWYPGDPMPSNVIGLRLAGDFAVQGTNSEGNPILLPAQSASNPFARQYWLINVHDTMGPDVLLPAGARPLVRVYASRPLVILSRGILPGIYNVAYE